MRPRILLLLLSSLLLLTACDPKRDAHRIEPRISSLSTTTPSVGGTLTINGTGFSATRNTVTIGGKTIPNTSIHSWNYREIKLTIPDGTPNGHLTVTSENNTTLTYDTPLHVITNLEVDPMVRIPGTSRFTITTRARDALGEPVPGARLIVSAKGGGKITPSNLITTNNTGTATATLDLEGVSANVEVTIWASPIYRYATFAENGDYAQGQRVTLTDGSISMPIYLELAPDGTTTTSTLNRRPDGPPSPRAATGNDSPNFKPSSGPPDPTQIIVAYHPTITLSSAARSDTLTAAGLQHATTNGNLDLARVPEGESLQEALARLNADPRVAYAEPNHYVRLAALPNDPQLYQQWGAFAVGAPATWPHEDGAGITVAVIDTAIDLTHPDLTRALLPGYDFCADNLDCSTYDDDPHSSATAANHGTHIAGIIAAAPNNGQDTVGIAPGARILPVKVFPEGNEYASVHSLATAIRWAAGINVDGAPTNPNPAHVINLSLGGDQQSLTLRDAINAAVSKGAVVVAATGNEYTGKVNYPAAEPNVLGVGAITPDWRRADYSNYGPGLDIVAPGSKIAASKPGGGTLYMTGTSMATPHVAAAAALLLARDPSLSPAQVKNTLKANTYWPQGATSNEFGAGVLRTDALVGLPAPTNDTDRYATLAIGDHTATLDLLEGTSTSVKLDNTSGPIQIRLTHYERELTGSLAP